MTINRLGNINRRPGSPACSLARASRGKGALPSVVTDVFGLEFPSNGESPEATMVAFRLTGANNPSPGYPMTYVYRYRPEAQAGYYSPWFYCNTANTSFDAGNGYYGPIPIPDDGLETDTDHSWCISTNGVDYPTAPGTNDDNGNDLAVVKAQWYTQAMVVRLVNTDELEIKFYWNLSVNVNRVITYTSVNDWANAFPPSGTPGIVFGDAPWSVGNERLSGILGPVKVINTNLSQADIVSEAADMTQLVTSAAQANRWWFKPTFDSVDDLTDAVTGKAGAWYNANKATRVQIT